MISRSIQLETDIPSANKVTAARFIGAFNHDDWDTVREVVADNFVFHHPIGGTVEAGPEGMVATWAGFKRLSPDSWHPVPILVAEGDHVAVLLPTYGHFTGRSDQAPPPTGGRLDYGMVNMVRLEAGKLAEMWFGMDPLAELQQMGVAPAFPPRRYRPTEQANLAAFLGASGNEPSEYDNVTAFDDTVIAFSPPQSDQESVTRRVEIYRVAGDAPALAYRHEITTGPPYGGDPSADTETSRAVVGRWFEGVLRGHGLGGNGRGRLSQHPGAPDGDADRGRLLRHAWGRAVARRAVVRLAGSHGRRRLHGRERRHRGSPLECPGNVARCLPWRRPDWPKPRVHGPLHVSHRGSQDR